MHLSPSYRVHTASRHGSALVLTLLVVSLLVVLVLAFSVHVRMELRSVREAQQLRQAQSNALLGANLAIARLQELAGPDTRVTAPTFPGAGQLPNAAHIGRAVDAAAYTGSNTLTFNPNYTRDLGYFVSHDPAAPFNPVTYAPFSAGGGVSLGNALLVGPGSVTASRDENSDGIPDGFVAAPLRAISGGAAGAYAWWIGDNGLKAQINLTDAIRESTGQVNTRAQATTAQRMGTERVLPAYNPANANMNNVLKRAVNSSQLNLTGYGAPDFSRSYFHDVTLQSLGLPTNTRRGGLKRDLSAVIAEAEDNGGNVNTSGAQWQQLMSYQTSRLNRWRAETVALPASQPAGLSLRHWNSLQALTLRPEQADPRLNSLIFPPLTDMHIMWDQGGAPWQQLISWVTLRQRRETPSGIQAARRWVEDTHITPVVAKVVLSNYFTVDWPDAAMHWVPSVVLWNPYDTPIVMNPARPWSLQMQFGMVLLGGNFWFRLKVRHDDWSAPSTSNYSHIQPKDELWTPKLGFEWDGAMVFQLRDSGGGTSVIIPPGEARMFAIHGRHQQLPANANGQPTGAVNVTLREGLDPNGQFSFYTRANFNNHITDNSKSRINDYIGNTYADASGGYNHWHTTNTRNRTYGNLTTRHLPYPFPLNTNKLESAHISKLAKLIPPGMGHIAVNDNGLNGWEILQIGAEIGRHNEEGSNLRDVRFSLLDTGGADYPLVEVLHPNAQVPNAIQAARSYDADNPWAPFGQINPVWTPIKIPGPTQPFTPATPGFPAWGFSYGLRLPDHAYTFNNTTSQGNAVAASIRWLTDFSPAAPFPNRDPASRIPQPGGWRFDRFGWKSAPMYVGGFFMGDNKYSDLSWTTPNDLNQFIGHSDDSLPGYGPGMVPRAILHEIPKNSEDIASVAGFMHAPLTPYMHDQMPTPRDLPGSPVGNTTARDRLPRAIAVSSANYGFMQPAYAIGNSNAHLLVARDRAEQSFYPSAGAPAPDESIPYASSKNPFSFTFSNGYTGNGVPPSYFPGYDSSWIYNEVLWDDFFFSPASNQRLIWFPPYTAANRDFTLSAERLLVAGAFNINSVSIPGWAMLLESLLDVDLGTGDSPAGSTPFSRFLSPLSRKFDETTDTFEDPQAYAGHRRLSRSQMWNDAGTPDDTGDDSGLAVEIVRQVRLRGPFLSLSDFVNRALLPASQDAHLIGLAGALQSAINETSLNDAMGTPSDAAAWIDPAANYSGTYQGQSAFLGLSATHAGGRRNEAAPGALMQADILARVGAVLTPRSDTFTIRAQGLLGDVSSPTALAWCEVTVQRQPDYVNASANTAGALPATLSSVNQAFGRRFKVIAFRWLSPDEI